jgi:protein-S-isoprenylcysteine O-methyltransferase Ste14
MQPTMYTIVAFWLWIFLFLIWLPAYFMSKRSAATPNIALQIVTSALFLACFFLLFDPSSFGLGEQITRQDWMHGAVGLLLTALGVALAIWARFVLGKNWAGVLTSITHGHELVQKGPYAWIRHPIYTGFIIGLFGTTLTIGTFASYIGFGAALVALVIRMDFEERMLRKEFGDAHGEYVRKTDKLLPYIW